ANDQTDINPNGNATTSLFGAENPAQDPVNGYGNESSNRSALTLGGKSYAVARTGYDEKDVTDYNLRTLRYDAALHYKLTSRAELMYTYRGTRLDNVYQRSNRFRLNGYRLQQHALQLGGPVVQARSYLTEENTGQSYNLRSMAENLDRSFKTDARWNQDYTAAWNDATGQGQTVAQAHATARTAADTGRLLPGTPEFEQQLAKLAEINNWDQGAALRVRAKLLHGETQVNVGEALRRRSYTAFPTWADLLVGADHRTYFIRPDGNYFINPEKGEDPYSTLTYGKTGGFVQAGARLLGEKLRLTATMRADKSDYFSTRFNPRLTAVYSLLLRHNFRVSYQSGYRFPSLFEGFSNVNSGQVKRVGGLRVMSDGVFENGYLRSSTDAFNNAVTAAINANTTSASAAEKRRLAIEQNQGRLVRNPYTYLKPEHIRSFEVGYKVALLPNARLLLDVDFYYNSYRDFIAQVEAYVPKTNNPDSAGIYLNNRATQNRYRLWTNAQSKVY
ncbi:MAG TPA: TonB-dependent receptor, partial [Hymenobacter sp.]|nr:TonB-dependent receptor [Hymenobacter sp.]